ncbi:MAG: restriction endonuclease subunit S [Bacteroidota bacterium]
MKSTYSRLGDYIKLVDKRNVQFKINTLLGINITKNFMSSVANVSESDLSNYKIIEKGQFAYSAMQVGRDETIRVALYTENKPAIISPAYLVFEVINNEEVHPEYLMMWFQRAESDRYGWFISDSSVRASLEWERFCDIQLPIPRPEIQKKYVDVYRGLMSNQATYESSLKDLQLICDTYIEDLLKKGTEELLGKYIQQSDERNSNLKINNLLGISVNKKFIQSNSKQTSLDLASYKVVKNRQFGYVTVTSRNGEKISIAILDGEQGLVSSTYIVFEVIDTSVLLPEFLYLWFQRTEFDRYARFHSWGSARETFDWADMCNVKIPLPDLKVQEAIVTIYHTLQTRKRINSQLIDMIKPLCPILIKGLTNEINETPKELVIDGF